MVRAFAHGAMGHRIDPSGGVSPNATMVGDRDVALWEERSLMVGRRIDPSWGGPIELLLIPASAPRLV